MSTEIKPGTWVRRKHIIEEELQVDSVGPMNVVILNEIQVFSVCPLADFWDRYEVLENE